MTIVSLVIGGVALVAMIIIAAYWWVTLPADARVPIHHGLGSYNNFVSKTVGLIAWPAGGALIYGIFGASAGTGPEPLPKYLDIEIL